MIDPIRTNYLLSEILRQLQVIKGQQAIITTQEHNLRQGWYVKKMMNISSTTLWRRVKAGILHPIRIGGTDYFEDEDIRRCIEESRRTRRPERKRRTK